MSVQIFAHILIVLFSYLLLNSKSSLYSLDRSPVSDTGFANIFFSQSVTRLPILLTASCAEQEFCNEVQLMHYIFHGSYL